MPDTAGGVFLRRCLHKQKFSANRWVDAGCCADNSRDCSMICKACRWQAAGGTRCKRTFCASHASSLLVLSPLLAAVTSDNCAELSC